MDSTTLRQIFERLDQALEHPTELLIRGGAAVLAHGLEQRVTLDIDILLFRGQRLTVKTPPAADLVIGKVKRLDTDDLSDIAFLIDRFRLTGADLDESFERLSARFKADPVVQDNLRFIKEDYL